MEAEDHEHHADHDSHEQDADHHGSGRPEQKLNDKQQAELQELRQIDLKVRAHEQAHLAAAGAHATSGASYTYRTGPDGQRYAVGGEVSIDLSPVSGDPEATAAKARQVRAAAMAPADPSPQDMRVASTASQMEQQALTQLAKERAAPQRDEATAAPRAAQQPDAGPQTGEPDHAAEIRRAGALQAYGQVAAHTRSGERFSAIA